MVAAESLRTERLILRQWRDSDVAPFAVMNADPVVMEYFPATLSAAETVAMIARIRAGFAANDMGLWALELPGEAALIGYAGLWPVTFEAPFAPAVEIGWRLARPFWGRGLATEASRAALADGFGRLGLKEIVSFTVPANARSLAVMERLRMRRDPEGDFEYPNLPVGHALRPHVLYRIGADD
jgi:RimJ/RimL family protein N-acetyltransferase